MGKVANFLIFNVYCHDIICFIDVEGAGRGAIARENLKAGDIALEIPVTVIISEEAVHKSDMVHFILEESCNLKHPINMSSIFIPTV